MKRLKNKFLKISEGEGASCFYCSAKTNFALYSLNDNSEVWCCPVCALKYGKIKRLGNLLRKYPIRAKKTENSLIKKREVGLSQQVLEVQQ